MSPTASIIVLTYNNLHYTCQCLESIISQTTEPDYELIIVDNASEDSTPQYLEKFADKHPNTTLILNSKNEGFARGINQATAAAQGEYLVFLNNDTIVTPGWLEGLLKYLQDPSVGMVGPVTNNSGNETRIKVNYTDLDGMESFAREYTNLHLGQSFEISMLPFLCVALQRATWEDVGSLDERFGMGMFEDDDYSLRLKAKGYKLLCAEDVFIHHWGSAGFSVVGFKKYWQLYLKNLEKFESKWGIKWQPHHYREELIDEQFRAMWEEKRDLALQVIKLNDQLEGVNKVIFDLFRIKRFLRRNLFPPDSKRARVLIPIFHRLYKFQEILRIFVVKAYTRLKSALSIRHNIRMRKHLVEELDRILAEHSTVKEVVVFAPTIPWNTPLFQRPHQMALALARQGCLVFFCELPVTDSDSDLYRITENLYVFLKGPFDIFQSIESPVVFTLAYNREYLKFFKNPRVVYEYIDDLSVLLGNTKTKQRNHNELVRTADIALATAGNLYQEIKSIRPDALMNPNAVNHEFIRKSILETREPPDDILEFVEHGTPIIGYYGALAQWFDYSLIIEVSQKLPKYLFLLIGPNYDDSIIKSDVLKQKNVLWLDAKPYNELPSYLKYFDVAIIPFLLNEVTHATSPLKLFEYMTAQKPIITTAMSECEKYPGVLIAEDSKDFINKIEEALRLREDESYLKILEHVARENTWDVRAKEILVLLDLTNDCPNS
jgi:GT2 family glycosyltransferase/glycosyltransferase involved in cell wall biosynthesis